MLLFWALLGGLIGFVAAQKRGIHPAAGILGGIFLGPLAFLMFFLTGVASKDDWGTKCRFCKESIKADAVICKHCGKRTDERPPLRSREVPPGRRTA